jgi:hypothetical protein
MTLPVAALRRRNAACGENFAGNAGGCISRPFLNQYSAYFFFAADLALVTSFFTAALAFFITVFLAAGFFFAAAFFAAGFFAADFFAFAIAMSRSPFIKRLAEIFRAIWK